MEYKPRLIKKYHEEIVPALQKQFNYTSIMQVPRLKKISVNQGIGSATTDKKQIDTGIEEMTKITGQLAVSTKSKKDISNYSPSDFEETKNKVWRQGEETEVEMLLKKARIKVLIDAIFISIILLLALWHLISGLHIF